MAGGEAVKKFQFHVEKVIFYEQKCMEYAHHKKYYKVYFKKYCYHKKMVHYYHKKGCGYYYAPWPYPQHQHHQQQPYLGMEHVVPQQSFPVPPNMMGPTPMGSAEMLANPARSLELGEVDY